METFFGRLKTEMYYGCEREFKTYEEFSKAIDEYIYYYNNERIQKKTKWMPPTLYRLASINVNQILMCPVFWVHISQSRYL